MELDRRRLASVWRRTLSLAAPVSAQHAFRTAMRTTDIIVTGLFSPAAVAALGLADLYAELPLRLGQGLGGGAIALSSQDTGSGATGNRDESVTQAILLGLLAGVPFAVFGLLFSQEAIAFLGASTEVARLGGIYLTVIFVATPARHVAMIGIAALQGTGDTRTPMVIEIAANAINIVGSVVLGLGVGPAPRLSILGVGLATAGANVFTATAILLAIRSDRTVPSFARPTNPAITRQLVAIGTPQFAEGLSVTIISFPFNALLLVFGTEVVAAFHIGRRLRQQFTGPAYRAFSTTASIVVGQALGAVDAGRARFEGWAVIGLSGITLGVIGLGLFFGAEYLVPLFTDDPLTRRYAIEFTRVFAIAGGFLGLFFTVSGALRGAGETRVPFVARLTGSLVFLLGVSYLASVTLGFGVPGIYAGILLSYFWMLLVGFFGFARSDWAGRAATMMADRKRAAADR